MYTICICGGPVAPGAWGMGIMTGIIMGIWPWTAGCAMGITGGIMGIWAPVCYCAIIICIICYCMAIICSGVNWPGAAGC